MRNIFSDPQRGVQKWARAPLIHTYSYSLIHTHIYMQRHTHQGTHTATTTYTHTPQSHTRALQPAFQFLQPLPPFPAHTEITITLACWDHCCGNWDSEILTWGHLDSCSDYDISCRVCALNSELFHPQEVRLGSQPGSWWEQAIKGLIIFCLSDGVALSDVCREAVSTGMRMHMCVCVCVRAHMCTGVYAHPGVSPWDIHRWGWDCVAVMPESSALVSLRPGRARLW